MVLLVQVLDDLPRHRLHLIEQLQLAHALYIIFPQFRLIQLIVRLLRAHTHGLADSTFVIHFHDFIDLLGQRLPENLLVLEQIQFPRLLAVLRGLALPQLMKIEFGRGALSHHP